jgi:heme/copper-type cytochrome/quinol oxidase subunit 1
MTRLPLTIWAFFVTAIIGVVSFPVLLSAALLLILIEVSVPLSWIFILLVKCYIIKVDRLFYLSTYFGF